MARFCYVLPWCALRRTFGALDIIPTIALFRDIVAGSAFQLAAVCAIGRHVLVTLRGGDDVLA